MQWWNHSVLFVLCVCVCVCLSVMGDVLSSAAWFAAVLAWTDTWSHCSFGPGALADVSSWSTCGVCAAQPLSARACARALRCGVPHVR